MVAMHKLEWTRKNVEQLASTRAISAAINAFPNTDSPGHPYPYHKQLSLSIDRKFWHFATEQHASTLAISAAINAFPNIIALDMHSPLTNNYNLSVDREF
jgi:hypothetical protein